MSYSTIARCVDDQAFIDRVTAGAVAEAWNNPANETNEYAQSVRLSPTNARSMVYPTAIAADIEAAYASALAGGNPDPGGDEAVITDAMILANLQAKWPDDAA